MQSATELHRQKLADGTTAWNRGDLEGYLALYDDAVSVHGYAKEPFDKAALRAFGKLLFEGARPEDRNSPILAIHETICERDLVANRFSLAGLHRGPLLGLAPTGRSFHIEGMSIFRFGHSGLVIERHVSMDLFGLLVQLGAREPL